MAARVEETPVAIAVDFRSEINPSTIKLLRSSLKYLRRGWCIAATAADKGFEQEIWEGGVMGGYSGKNVHREREGESGIQVGSDPSFLSGHVVSRRLLSCLGLRVAENESQDYAIPKALPFSED
ncbi:hypothetical protein ACFX1T_009924 [Malus domestica]